MKAQNQDILIKGCLSNNRKAQKQLYDAYKNSMFTICVRITGNFEDAKDALQDGFISVFNDISKFRGEASLGAWIKIIMIRAAIKKLKSLQFVSDNLVPDTSVEWDEEFTGEHLHKAIMTLSDGYRAVFTMYEVEGYSHHEIATILNISEGTSKSQLHFAKKKLKDILKNYL